MCVLAVCVAWSIEHSRLFLDYVMSVFVLAVCVACSTDHGSIFLAHLMCVLAVCVSCSTEHSHARLVRHVDYS